MKLKGMMNTIRRKPHAGPSAPPDLPPPPRLQLGGIGKRFHQGEGIRGINLEVQAGEIHALLGEADAGRSVLIGIVGGAIRPDAGRILVDGLPLRPGRPACARAAGVCAVRGEPALAPHLSVEENLVLGSEPASGGWLDRERQRELARNALALFNSQDIPLDLCAAMLSRPQRQRVALARAFLGKPKVLALDEASASLSPVERENLFASIRDLAGRGAAVLYATRFYDEARELCGRYTLLRRGEAVAAGSVRDLDSDRGRFTEPLIPRRFHPLRRPVLELRERGKAEAPAALTLHEGEIFGLTGLPGAGCRAVLLALGGLPGGERFEVRPSGELNGFWPRVGMMSGLDGPPGIGGLLPGRDLAENLTLSRLNAFGRFGFISLQRQRMAALDWMKKLHIEGAVPVGPVEACSPANRRRAALGRLLHGRARLLLFEEPAWRADPEEKARIGRLIGELASEGKVIVLFSSSIPELLALCDSIGVMRGGRLAETRPVSKWTGEEIADALRGL